MSKTTMTLSAKEITQLVREGDKLVFTTLECPDCHGRVELDVDIATNPPEANHPAELVPVLVCTECGRACSSTPYIYSPRDTASKQG